MAVHERLYYRCRRQRSNEMREQRLCEGHFSGQGHFGIFLGHIAVVFNAVSALVQSK